MFGIVLRENLIYYNGNVIKTCIIKVAYTFNSMLYTGDFQIQSIVTFKGYISKGLYIYVYIKLQTEFRNFTGKLFCTNVFYQFSLNNRLLSS